MPLGRGHLTQGFNQPNPANVNVISTVITNANKDFLQKKDTGF